jgi:hypothetical protein
MYATRLLRIWRRTSGIPLARPDLPGLPVADLRGGSEQERVVLAGLADLKRQHEARTGRS